MNKLAVVDIETLDTAPTAVIVSIGCVIVDSKNLEVVDEFYQVINRNQPTRSQDLDTVNWWFEQANKSPEAFNEVLKSYDAPTDLETVLEDFAEWLKIVFDGDKIQMFGNGPEFDNTILEHAYKQHDMETPWPFWCNQSMRTINLLKAAFDDDLEKIEFVGNKHHALDDAQHEAKQLLQAIGLFKEIKHLADIAKADQNDVVMPLEKQEAV